MLSLSAIAARSARLSWQSREARRLRASAVARLPSCRVVGRSIPRSA
jgi:hypothetical protein